MATAASPLIDISVIFPLIFVRGPTERVIESWTRLQRMPRHRYEVIVVSPGKDRETEELIRSYLDRGDSLVTTSTNDLYALYDLGIRRSRGRIVMITESHVMATGDCLQRMLETLDDSVNEAACCNAVAPGNEGYLATMEAMLFQEESTQWTAEGSWRRVHERGFAIYRDTYYRFGGFPYEYGWFAGRAFAARLHAAGVPVAYAPDVRVTHYNSVNIADIIEGARSFTRGELRHREREDELHVRRYFGTSGALVARERYRGSNAFTEIHDHLQRLGSLSWSQRIRTLRRVPHLAITSIFGINLLIISARIQAGIARAKVEAYRPWGPAAGLDAYRDYWHIKLVRRFQLEYCREETAAPKRLDSTTVRAEDIATPSSGFHPTEYFAGEAFRWSTGVAAIRMRIPEAGSRLRLAAAPIGPSLDQRALNIYLEGRKLHLDFHEPFLVSARIPFIPGTGQSGTLVIACNPSYDATDSREMGIPFRRVETVAAEAAAAAAISTRGQRQIGSL